MTKRILAWVLALTMIASLLPVSVTAEGEPVAHSHSQAQHACQHCTDAVTWQAWGDTDTEKKTLPTTSGHYYLVSDITKTARTDTAETADIVLCLNGYTIDGNKTDTIYRINGSTKVRIDDCTAYTDAAGEYHAGKLINGKCTGGVGGTFYIHNTASLTMTAGIVSDSQNLRTTTDLGYGGALHVRDTGVVYLENVVFQNCYATKDGGILSKRGANSQLTAKNCTFKDSSSDTQGGVMMLMHGSATFENCTFSGNTAANGSVFYLRETGLLTLKDCVLENNTATSGSSGTFYMYKGKALLDNTIVKNNIAGGNGGSAVYMTYTSTLTLKDSTITGNKFTGTSTGSRAAIYLTKAEDKLILQGKTVIKDNMVATGGSAPFNRSIFLQAATTVDVGGLTDGACVEIYSHTWAVDAADDIVSAATAPTSWKRTWVIHENSGNAIEYTTEKGFHFALNTDHIHCQCGNSACTDSSHQQVEYSAWNDATALPTTGNYYLNTDVTLTKETSVDKNLNLCLNGHTVTAAAGKRHISTPKDAGNTIVIADCTAATVGGVYTAGSFTGGVDKGSGQGGGAIYIRAGGTLKIYDGIFSNNTSITGGGAIRMAADTNLLIEYAEFIGNTAVTADGAEWKSGGAISAITNTNVTILGGKFTDNKGLQGGAIYCYGATFTLENVTFQDNYGYSNAGAIYAKTATTTIENCTFTGNYGTKDGGALYYREGKITITDSSFMDNEDKIVGGAISFSGAADATITGSTFENNKGTSGGAMIVQGDATLTINGGTFQNNTATNKGGALYLYKGTVNLNDAQITGNTAANSGGAIEMDEVSALTVRNGEISGNTSPIGAVNLNAASSLTLEGAPRIMANQGGNLNLMDASPVKIGTMTDGANVCVTGNPGAFSEACQDYANYFVADSRYLKVEYVEGALHLAAGGEHKHCLCNSNITGCNHGNIAWVAWESTSSLPTSGSYYLLNDVTLTAEVSISRDLNLCLNGHTVTAASGKRILSTPTGADVTISITDCTAAVVNGVYTAGALTGGDDQNTGVGGGAIYLRAGATLNLFEGKLTGNKAIAAAGAILLTTDCVLNVYGGEFADNTAISGETMKPGGAIYAMKGAEVNVFGGTFAKNTGSQGGAIWADGSATKLTVSGGTFTENHATVNGAAIYGKQAEVVITGGTYENNTALKDGGALYYREGTINLLGGQFRLNQSTGGAGGAISFSGNAVVNMGSPLLEENTAGSGGAMILQGGSTTTIENATIRNNTNRGQGGGIYVYGATLTVNGGTFAGNEAQNRGGAIHATNNSVLTVNGGTFQGNHADINGGGIYAKQADVQVTGGQFLNNTSLKDGAGIYFREGNMDISGDVLISGNHANTTGGGLCYSGNATGTISGGIIEKNTTGGSGGGMIIQGGSKVEITGGVIRDHVMKSYGGAIYLHNSELTISGGEITGNKVANGGGAIYVAQDNAKLTIAEGANLNKNQAKNGGAILAVNRAHVEMTGGKISGNTTQKGSGGGIYISTNCTFKMTGGQITGNRVTGAAGGVYLLRSTGTFSGGSISGNYAEGAGGGGIHVNGATAYLYGISITNNEAKASGGGINSARTTSKGVDYSPTFYVSGAYIANNKAKTGGGMVVSGNGGKLYYTSGTITNNEATGTCGGLYVSSKITIKMTGGTVSNNTAKGGGAGMYANKAVGTIENAKFIGNTSTGGAGGGMYLYRGTRIDLKNVVVENNTANTVGGGVYADSHADYYTETAMDNCLFRGNTAGTRGGGFYGSFGVEFDAVNCLFQENIALGGGTDSTTGNGGAIAVRDIARLKDCAFVNNKAEYGGAFYGGNMQLTYSVNGWGTKADEVGVTMENCAFTGNDASIHGGAIHNAMSSFATLTGCTFTGNSAAHNGSAIYAEDDLTMIDVTITDNVSGSNGYAMYYADSEFDGRNYIRGLFKVGGDMLIKDNQGGDVYFDNCVTVTLAKELGSYTEMRVTLDKGVLTNRLYGAYNYEGGDLVYTVTYGTRSLTEPEVDPTLQQQAQTQSQAAEEENAKANAAASKGTDQNIWLYVGIGALALVVLAVAVIIPIKKKKSAKPAAGESK